MIVCYSGICFALSESLALFEVHTHSHMHCIQETEAAATAGPSPSLAGWVDVLDILNALIDQVRGTKKGLLLMTAACLTTCVYLKASIRERTCVYLSIN